MFHSGYSYESVNSARSALSSLCDMQDGHLIGSHPVVVRFMTGLFNLCPSKPKYIEFWDTSKVLSYIRQLPSVKALSLKMLSLNLAMLVALTQASRSHSMSLLSLEGLQKDSDSYVLFYCGLLKQCRKGRRNPIAKFKKYDTDDRVCIYRTLEEYIKRTEILRGSEKRLFVSYIKPYKCVTSSTISRWIRSIMSLSGIDMNKFNSHSVRGASTSKAKSCGVSVHDILSVAGWSGERTFATYYSKPIKYQENDFDEAVLG